MIVITWNLSVTKAKNLKRNQKFQTFQKLYISTFDIHVGFRYLVSISIFLFEIRNRCLHCNFSLSFNLSSLCICSLNYFFQQYFLYFRNYVKSLHFKVTITEVTNICRETKHIWHISHKNNSISNMTLIYLTLQKK